MRFRRILYLAAAAFLLLYLFNNSLFDANPSKPVIIMAEDIIKDFTDLSDNSELPPTANLPGQEKYLYISKDFKGQVGEVFYIVADEIYQYKIELATDSQTISYNLKNSFNNIRLPEDRFTIYDLNE